MLQQLRGAHPPPVAQFDLLGDRRHHVDHPHRVVEFEPLLAVIAEANGFAYVDHAAVGSFDARQQLEQRRLAAAVVAHDPQLFVAGEVVVELVEDHHVAEAFAHVAGLEYLGADPRRPDVEPHLAAAARRFEPRFEIAERVDARPRLGRPRLRLAAHPLQFAAVEVHVARPLCRVGRFTLLFLFQVIGVVARIVVDPAVFHFEDVTAHAVEEIPVVGHHQQPCTACREVLFEPLGHVGVEVVGRLVEDQQVGFADQHVGQRHALELPAREGLHFLPEVADPEP